MVGTKNRQDAGGGSSPPTLTDRTTPCTPAEEEIVKRLLPEIVGAAHRIAGDMDRAEDLAQDVIMRLFIREDLTRLPPKELKAVAVTAAKNRFRDFQRGQKRAQEKDPLAAAWAQHAQVSPLDEVCESETRKAVRDAIESLPPRQRDAVTLHALKRLPFSEVANILGITVDAAKNAASTGRKRLLPLLQHLREG